jgi:peptide deformylase
MLTMKDIIREGHKTLEIVADPVPLPLSDEDKKTLKLMREFLINSQDEEIAEQYELRAGVGLAAPQINLRKRMLAIYTVDENFETLHDYLMVNPKIISHTELLTYMPGGEGCLSIDRPVEGLVPRYKRVTVKTHLYDVETDTLKEETLRLKGFVSIVFQHELDHLNGILFPSKVTPTLEGVEPVHFKTIEKEETEE